MQHHGYGAPHGQGQYGHPYPPPGYPPPPGYGHPPPPPGFGPPPPPPPGYSHDPEAYGHPSRADQREGRSEHREADYGHSNGYQRGEDGFGAGSDRTRRKEPEERRKGDGRPKGKGKGEAEAGSRELLRSRSRSASSGSAPKKRSRRAAGFDCASKPREPGKVPVEATPQRGLELAPGRKADVHGLKGSSQYNGCEGIVIEGPNDKGRWEVQVDYQCETKTLLLQESNLQPKPSCGWELIVAPISPGVAETDVSQVLVKHGRVRHVKMTNPVGVCLVEMALKEDAEAAVALKTFELMGSRVSIDWSTAAKVEIGVPKEPPAPEPPRSEEPLGFQLEQEVLVSGLKGSPQFNGLKATVVGKRADRVEVEIEADGGKKLLALKPENLSPAVPAAVPAPRRRKGWEEPNSGGYVVGRKLLKPLPAMEELEQLPVKELREVLKEHGVDVTGCLERAEFLEKAKEY